MPKFPLFAFLPADEAVSKLRTIGGIDLTKESTTAPQQLNDAAGDSTDSAEPHAEELPSPDATTRPPHDEESTSDSQAAESHVPVAERLSLSLADARASALAANLDLRVEQVNPAIARQIVSQEAGRFEATFNSSYVRNRIDPPPGVLAGGPPDTTFDIFNNSITQPLVAGGSVIALHDFTKTDIHGSNAFNSVDTDLGVEYRQPLLRDFGYKVNTASIQIARAQTEIADARSKLTAIRVLAEVERAYWRLYAAHEFREIAAQQLDLARQQSTGVKRLFEAGVFTNVDALVAESGVLVREDAAIQSQTDVLLAERELKRIMQNPIAPVGAQTEIVLVTEPNPLGLTFDRENLAARGIDNRMEMLELQLRLLADSIASDVERNSILPRLDLTAEIDALGLESSYRKSMDVLFENDFGDRLVGIALEVPLSGNVSARARLREVQLRMMQTRIEQERAAVLITQEVYNAVDRVEQNWERIVATRRAEFAADRAYQGQSRLQQAGRQIVTDVLVALQNLGDARAQAVQAVVDYQIAKVDLALAAGAMLGYGQVDWSPCDGPQSPLPDAVSQNSDEAESAIPTSTELRLLPPVMPTEQPAAADSSPLWEPLETSID